MLQRRERRCHSQGLGGNGRQWRNTNTLHALQVPALAPHVCARSRAQCCCLLLVAPLRSLLHIARSSKASFARALNKPLRGRLPVRNTRVGLRQRPDAQQSRETREDCSSLLAPIMADNKRQSMVGKVATPNLKAGGVASKDVGDADSNLYKAVGSRYAPLALRILPLGSRP